MDKTRIVIADDHPVMRRRLTQMIESNPILKVIAEPGTVMPHLLKSKL